MIFSLEYGIVLVLIVIIVIGGVILKRKWNVKNSDLNFVQLILESIDYVSSNIDYKYKGSIKTVIEYVCEAIELIQENENVDLETKKQNIFKKAAEICEENEIKIDIDLNNIISGAIDFFVLEGVIK